MDAVKAGLALGACRMYAHAVHAEISSCHEFGFFAAVKAALAKPLRQACY
jgi:hypothetical protein